MATAGIKDLKTNLSKYIALAVQGEPTMVTEHGRPVAVLSPLPGGLRVLEEMRRAGRVTWGGGLPKSSPVAVARSGNPDVAGAVVANREEE